MQRKDKPILGVVIPCYNEAEVLPILIEELQRFSTSLPYEACFLFVDDGSTDETDTIINDVIRADNHFGMIRLSRNFGHQAALTAGLKHARGDIVAIIDADLQDPLDALPRMIEKWQDGFDIVYGVRQKRKEHFILVACYSLFYRLFRMIANIEIPLDAGDFCILDRRVVDTLNQLPEQNRFVRGLRCWVGFKQTGVQYARQARAAGRPKYSAGKLVRLALDGIITFSSVPLRLASWIGVTSALFGIVLLLYVLISKAIKPETPIGWASLAAIVIFYGGVQLLVLGIIGEYVGRMFDEVKRRPAFIVTETAGWIRDNEDPAQAPNTTV